MIPCPTGFAACCVGGGAGADVTRTSNFDSTVFSVSVLSPIPGGVGAADVPGGLGLLLIPGGSNNERLGGEALRFDMPGGVFNFASPLLSGADEILAFS